MADIAELGFRVDTSDLDRAATKLNAIKPAAAGASASAQKLAATIEGASNSIANAAVMVAQAEKAKADALLASAKASTSSTEADIENATAARNQAAAAVAVAKAEAAKTAAINASASATRQAENAVLLLAEAYKLQTTAARNAFNAAATANTAALSMPNVSNQNPSPANPNATKNPNANRFYTGNIEAQFQDIGVTAAMGMNPLTIALQQGTQLADVLQQMEDPVKGLQQGFGKLFGTISLGVIAAVALVATLIEVVNWTKFAKTALYDLASAIQKAGIYVLGFAALLALLYAPTILAGMTALVSKILQIGVAATIAGAEMAYAWIAAMGPIDLIIAAIALVVAGLLIFKKQIAEAFGVDVVAGIKKGVNEVIAIIAGVVAVVKNIPNEIKGTGEGIGATFNKAFDDEIKKDPAGQLAIKVQSGMNKAATAVKKFADNLGQTKPWAALVADSNKMMASLQAERNELNLSAQAAAQLKYQTDLLNIATEKKIKLTPQEKEYITQQSAAMAKLSIDTAKTTEAMDLAKDAAKGFLSDMTSGLQQGQSLWQAFGNAVLNVLNKIVSKMEDSAIDAFFQGSGNGQGIAGSIVSGLKSMLPSAKGNVFNAANDNGRVAFAKGGMFTNSIVSKPTAFAFGAGGQFGGIMGERGPEAVMPLTRGPDGSLGVKAMNSGSMSNGGDVEINIINNNGSTVTQQKRQTNSGTSIDVMIDDTVASKVSDPSSSTNRAMKNRDARQLIRR